MHIIMIDNSQYLMHHGVKGMKWGVRKVDTNTDRMKSNNVYSKISDLETQERLAKKENRKNYRSAKKNIKSSLKSQKKSGQITKEEFKSAKRQGIDSVRKVLADNNVKIRSNFNEAYFDHITAGEIATARSRNNYGQLIDSIFSSSSSNSYYYDQNEAALKRAEARRQEFTQDYVMRNRKKKK